MLGLLCTWVSGDPGKVLGGGAPGGRLRPRTDPTGRAVEPSTGCLLSLNELWKSTVRAGFPTMNTELALGDLCPTWGFPEPPGVTKHESRGHAPQHLPGLAPGPDGRRAALSPSLLQMAGYLVWGPHVWGEPLHAHSCALRGKTPGLNQAVPEWPGWPTSPGAQDSPDFAGDLTSFTEFTYKWCWLLWHGTPRVPPAFVLTSPEPCPRGWGRHLAACSQNYVYILLCPSAAVVRGPVGALTWSLLGSLCFHQPAHDFRSARVLGAGRSPL